jgi:hypothetical protein
MNITFGYGWRKGHDEKSLRGILASEEDNWIHEMIDRKEIGREVKDLNSLPKSVKGYIEKIKSEGKMEKGGKAVGFFSESGDGINWLITG